MSRELSKEQFIERLKTRDNGKCKYLYQVNVLRTPNENYVKYAYDYIINCETEEIGSSKLQLKGIETVKRQSSYKYSHSQTAQRDSGRDEEWFVLDIWKKSDRDYVKEVFGKIVDYQVPLKNVLNDKQVGKIDFIFEKDGELYLAEIKDSDSNESALKAIVEVQTYYQIADKVKLLSSYEKAVDTKIKKAVVLFVNSIGAKQIKENALVRDLLNKFEIEPIIIDGTANSFKRV